MSKLKKNTFLKIKSNFYLIKNYFLLINFFNKNQTHKNFDKSHTLSCINIIVYVGIILLKSSTHIINVVSMICSDKNLLPWFSTRPPPRNQILIAKKTLLVNKQLKGNLSAITEFSAAVVFQMRVSSAG
jgi:hypothetical protein